MASPREAACAARRAPANKGQEKTSAKSTAPLARRRRASVVRSNGQRAGIRVGTDRAVPSWAPVQARLRCGGRETKASKASVRNPKICIRGLLYPIPRGGGQAVSAGALRNSYGSEGSVYRPIRRTSSAVTSGRSFNSPNAKFATFVRARAAIGQWTSLVADLVTKHQFSEADYINLKLV